MRLNRWLALLLAALLCGALAMGALGEEANAVDGIELSDGMDALAGGELTLELDADAFASEPMDLPEIDGVELDLGGQLLTDPEAALTEASEAQRNDAGEREEFEVVNGVLVRYNGQGGDVTVPDGVTEIGENVFRGRSDLTGVKLPEGLKIIRAYAFNQCKGLTAVTLPGSLESLSPSAFLDSGLTRVTIRSNITVLDDHSGLGIGGSGFDFQLPKASMPFYGCPLTAAVVEDGVTEIPDCLFGGCDSLCDLTLSKDLTAIPEGAFMDCRALTGIVLPQGVTSIGNCAFINCSALSGIDLPEGLATIGEGAFFDCKKLTAVTLPAGLKSLAWSAFENSGLTNVTIRGNFSIPEERRPSSGAMGEPYLSFDYIASPFASCPLSTAAVEDSVNELPIALFGGCKSLNKVTLSKNLKVVPVGTFWGCEALAGIRLPEGVESIGSCAFLECKALAGIGLPNSLTTIGDGAFYHCEALTGIDLPAGLKRIGNVAFCGTALTEIVIPSVETEVGEQAFVGCNALKNITIDPRYLWSAFSRGGMPMSLDTLTVLSGVTAIESLGPVDVKKIVLPDTLTTLGDHAFYGIGVTSINLPDSLTSIGDMAFMYCKKLTSLTIPPKVNKLGDGTFVGCEALKKLVVKGNSPSLDLRELKKLTTVSVTGNVKKILLWNCTKLTDLTLSPKAKTVEVRNAPALKKLNVPATVQELILADCKKLSALTVPVGVKTLDLTGCAKLTKLEIPSTVTSLRLAGCKGLKGTLFIPRSVGSIDASALQNCAKLQIIVVESGVKAIRDSAFNKCKALKAVVIPDTVKGIGVDAIPSNKGLVIYGGKDSYAQLYAKTAKITFKTFPKTKKVTLNRTGTVSLKAKEKLQLIAILSPVGAQEKLKWTSSKKSVATVSANGVVTAKKAGTATITVKTASGKKASVKIRVKK